MVHLVSEPRKHVDDPPDLIDPEVAGGQTIDYSKAPEGTEEDSPKVLHPRTALRIFVGTGMQDVAPARKAVMAALKTAKERGDALDDPNALQAFLSAEIFKVVTEYIGDGTPAHGKLAEQLAQLFIEKTVPALLKADEERTIALQDAKITPLKTPFVPRAGMPKYPFPQLVIPKAEKPQGDAEADPYRLIHKVGQGGFGSVWRAIDARRCTAIKLLHLRTPESEARFEREGKISELANDTGALPIFYEYSGHSKVLAHGEVSPFMANEFVPGRTLDTVLKEIDDPKMLRYLFCRIVQKLHDLGEELPGFVHRDIKPQNIMVTFSPLDVIILDLGMARADAEGVSDDLEATMAQSGLTQQGALMGTLEWMSPEQIQGDWKKVGARSDLWAVAAIFYQAMTGRFPNMTSSEYEQRKGGRIHDLLIFLSAKRQEEIADDSWNAAEDKDPDFTALLKEAMRVDPNARPAPAVILQRAKELAPSVSPNHEQSSAETGVHHHAGIDTPPDLINLSLLLAEQLTDVEVRKFTTRERFVRNARSLPRRFVMGAAAVAAIAVGLATYGFSRNDQKNPDASAVQTAKEGAPEKENKHPAMLQNVDMQHPENTTLALLGGAQLKPKAAWKFGEASFGTMYDCQPSEVEPLLKSLYSSDPDLWECIKSRLIGEQHNGNSVRAYGYTSPSGTIIDVCDHCTIIISADGRMKYFLSEVSGGNPKTDDPKKIQTYEAVDKKRFTSGTSGRYNCPELIQILGEIPNKEPSSEDGDGKGYIHKRIKMFRAGVKNYGPNKEIKVVNKI